MDSLHKTYRLYRELSGRRHPVSLSTLAEILECTPRNVKNIIAKLRRAGAPIDYDYERNGYTLNAGNGDVFELPGLWFNASELYALLASHQLLSQVQPGWLTDYIQPLKGRIEKLLNDAARDFGEIQKRVRILQIAARPTRLDHFQKVSEALIDRRQLKIFYHGRATDKTTERIVSPQRLVYYRSNWYLDAWCHWREGLRSFAIDRLHPVALLDHPALEIIDAELDEHFTTAYGIFAGKPAHTAHLRFSAHAAKWVADEHWHPDEQRTVLPDGRYELKVPYGDPTELIMDILKYGPEAEVLGPPALREAVVQRIQETAGIYLVKN